MIYFFMVSSLQLNSYKIYTTVRVGLLHKKIIKLFNVILTGTLRPTLTVNQQSMMYAKNMYTSTVAKWVGLKYISIFFLNGFSIQARNRPTPTFIGAKRGVSL